MPATPANPPPVYQPPEKARVDAIQELKECLGIPLHKSLNWFLENEKDESQVTNVIKYTTGILRNSWDNRI